MKKTLTEQVMTTPVVTAAQAMPFRDLVALLHARDIGAVPVVATAGQVLGVVSRADLTAKAAGPPAAGPPLRRGSRRERRRALARTASELMTAPAVTIAPDATIEQAARAMRSHRVGRLPVTFRLTGRLAGIGPGPTCCASTCGPARRSAARSKPRYFPECTPRTRGA